jgi:hypothetical protein
VKRGGLVLIPDEMMAALNPEFMIEWATPILGADNSSLLQAQTLLQQKKFLESLSTIRDALSNLPVRKYDLVVQQAGTSYNAIVSANAWITDLAFNQSTKQLSFKTHGPPGGTINISITIPDALIAQSSSLTVDGQPQKSSVIQVQSNIVITLELAQGLHQIELK